MFLLSASFKFSLAKDLLFACCSAVCPSFFTMVPSCAFWHAKREERREDCVLSKHDPFKLPVSPPGFKLHQLKGILELAIMMYIWGITTSTHCAPSTYPTSWDSTQDIDVCNLVVTEKQVDHPT